MHACMHALMRALQRTVYIHSLVSSLLQRSRAGPRRALAQASKQANGAHAWDILPANRRAVRLCCASVRGWGDIM